ncbi:MAG: hypothetical protein L3J30_12105 [Marinosulfonomonas sp.]|nr:hypothetical protein [Marinosulfonomonas sp.]
MARNPDHREPMLYVCDGAPEQSVIVNVIRCTDMPLSKAAASLGISDEWPDDVMLAGMREHYPDIKLSDIVQIIDTPHPANKKAAQILRGLFNLSNP